MNGIWDAHFSARIECCCPLKANYFAVDANLSNQRLRRFINFNATVNDAPEISPFVPTTTLRNDRRGNQLHYDTLTYKYVGPGKSIRHRRFDDERNEICPGLLLINIRKVMFPNVFFFIGDFDLIMKSQKEVSCLYEIILK